MAAAPDDGVMCDDSDHDLLQAFAERGDEAAFAEVVKRWGTLVYGAALRRTGDRSVAEEVAQNVLTTLARRAGELASHPALPAWLHKAASFEAARALEKESNRRRLMHRYAHEKPDAVAEPEPVWRDALPLLDAAIASLPERDREVLILRYWQERPYRLIAEAAGSTAAACEKRAERALSKLSRILGRRGVVIGAAALAAGLTPAVTQAAAPPAVLARLTTGALGAAQAPPVAGGIFSTLILMKSKLAPAAALAVFIALCGTGGYVAARAMPLSSSRPSAAPAMLRPAPVGAPMKPPPARPIGPRRASLQALLAAAQRDLVVAAMDPAAAARAAARMAVIAPDDIRAALAIADEMVSASGDSLPLVALVLQRWAAFDGPAACDAAHQRRNGRFLGMPPLADPLKVWAARDPQAAFDWYRANASAQEAAQGDGQRWKPISSLRWIMGAWALSDATAAATAFKSLSSPEEISGALTGFSELSGTASGRTAILDAWLEKNPGQRQEWSDLRDLFQRWSAYQPSELAAWLDRREVPQSDYDSAAKPILAGWLREDAAAAVDWWFNAPGGYPERSQRMSSLVDAWTGTDVFAAAEWLASQPLDATAARSMGTLAATVARSDPERGWEWAMRIPDEYNRSDALRQVIATWVRADKDAATAAVTAANLDPATRSALLEAVSAR